MQKVWFKNTRPTLRTKDFHISLEAFDIRVGNNGDVSSVVKVWPIHTV